MVVEPGEDFVVGAVGEAVVGDVCLPGFVGLFGLEADVGGFRFFLWFGCDQVGAADDPVDRGSRPGDLVMVLEVPVDGVGAGVEAFCDEAVAEFEDQVDGCWWGCVGLVVSSS